MDILQRLMTLHEGKEHAFVVGIDGGSGAGKTSLAQHLQQELPNVTIIATADFMVPLSQQAQSHYKKIGGEMDWQRLKEQVLIPLAMNKAAKYWCYEPAEPMTQQWKEVPPQGIVIVEGIYSTRLELAPYYDLKIWVDAPKHIRLARNIAKDGHQTKAYWEQEQLPQEQYYIDEHLPHKYADMLLDGSTKLFSAES